MLYIVPIEPYEERYTKQWSKWIPKALKENGINYTIIDSDKLGGKIQYGEVLDAYGTNYYKAGQLKTLCKIAKLKGFTSDDVILFMDGWFPGVEMLEYIRSITGKKFKIFAVFHAGSYDPADFTVRYGFNKWAEDLENSWFKIYDGIFVGSQWHKELITKNRSINKDKIYVTGLPFDYVEIQISNNCSIWDKTNKKQQVTFPHRLDPEKQPRLVDELNKSGFNIIKTKDVCKDKKQYYQTLKESKVAVSFALQETFGFAMLEAMALRCFPVVPDKLSYKNIIPDEYRYRTLIECKEKINLFLKKKELVDFDKHLLQYMPFNVVCKWLKIMEL